jgi:hypothetical protein
MMSPEEQLTFLEETAALADMLDDIRKRLVDKGWTKAGAENAAIAVYVGATTARRE